MFYIILLSFHKFLNCLLLKFIIIMAFLQYFVNHYGFLLVFKATRIFCDSRGRSCTPCKYTF